MSIEYIRKTYGVPAKRGGRVRYTDSGGDVFLCTIKAAHHGYLIVRCDDGPSRMFLHPTWQVEYLAPIPAQEAGRIETGGER